MLAAFAHPECVRDRPKAVGIPTRRRRMRYQTRVLRSVGQRKGEGREREGRVLAVSLVSGLSIGDPLARLTRFCEHEYAYYDAVPKGDPNRVEPVDVLATVGINSRIDTADKVRIVHLSMAASCDPLLPDIPPEADLLRFEPLDAVVELLSAAMKARYVLLASATKVLHRKRPGLIPVLDSVVVAHYLDRLGEQKLLARSWEDRTAAKEAGRLALLGAREDLKGASQEINDLAEALSAAGFHLAPVRVLDILVWSETERAGYYRTEGGMLASGPVDP